MGCQQILQRSGLCGAVRSGQTVSASVFPVARATLRFIQPARQPIRRIPSGRISLLRSAINTSAKVVCSRSNVKPGGFFWEMFTTQPAGTSDTSRIATDHINNPNAINPIFLLNARLSVAAEETLGSTSLVLPDYKPDVESTACAQGWRRFRRGARRDGAGLHQHRHVLSALAATTQRAHWIEEAEAVRYRDSAEELRLLARHAQKLANVAKFFMKVKPYRLEDAPGGSSMSQRRKDDETRQACFCRNCAKCHSSKRPPAGTASEEAWFRTEILKADFRDDNFFSDEKRYPVARSRPTRRAPVQPTRKRGHIWEQLLLRDLQRAPVRLAEIDVWNPYTGQDENLAVPGGGPGYYRTPSLISLWSSAPFLHNNALGKFTGDPSVRAAWRHSTTPLRNCSGPRSASARTPSGAQLAGVQHPSQGAVIPSGAAGAAAPAGTWTRTAISASGPFRRERRSTCCANFIPTRIQRISLRCA